MFFNLLFAIVAAATSAAEGPTNVGNEELTHDPGRLRSWEREKNIHKISEAFVRDILGDENTYDVRCLSFMPRSPKLVKRLTAPFFFTS